MANPTFNSVVLTSVAPRVRMGQPAVRVYFERMPGVKGEYVQTHGYGGRDWTITGVLHGTAQASRALAVSYLKQALAAKHAQADGIVVGTFLDADGTTSYTNCIMLQYEQASDIWVGASGSNWIGKCRIQATIRELAPS